MKVTRKDIIKNIVNDTSLTKDQSTLLLNQFLELIIKNSKSSKVKLSKFGSFSVYKTPSRLGRNPKTLKSYEIPPKMRMIFQASNILKKYIN